MNLGLDYDGTISEEPAVFMQFVKALRMLGHKVYIVTMRYESECKDIVLEWGDHVDGIHATARQAKGDFMKNLGIDIHVWADDNPRSVNESALSIWGWVSPEGHVITPVHTEPSFVVENIKLGYYSGMNIIDTDPSLELLIHIEKPKND